MPLLILVWRLQNCTILVAWGEGEADHQLMNSIIQKLLIKIINAGVGDRWDNFHKPSLDIVAEVFQDRVINLVF